MKFTITYMVGRSVREKNINANNLYDAEVYCNQNFTHWTNIIMIDKTQGEEINEFKN